MDAAIPAILLHRTAPKLSGIARLRLIIIIYRIAVVYGISVIKVIRVSHPIPKNDHGNNNICGLLQ